MTMRHTYEVLVDISEERNRQNEKWGDQSHHPDGTGSAEYQKAADHHRTLCDIAFKEDEGSWAHILLEEVYEALAEKDADKLVTELIQVAAVATAWVEAVSKRGAK